MTAELAMTIPVLVAVTAGLVWLLSVGFDQLRMVDAARGRSRALARGDDRVAALDLGRRVAPEGARFSVVEADGLVTVRASGPAGPPGLALKLVPDVELSAEAVALVEEPG